MPDTQRLKALLQRIDGRAYPSYRDLRGDWRIEEMLLRVDHIQGDPFAAPSRIRIQLDTGIDAATCTDPDRRLAAEDWLLRRLGGALSGARRGSGRSGELRVYRPGPEVVSRSAVRLQASGQVEVRLWAGLPASGRRVLGRQAYEMLTGDLLQAAGALWEAPQHRSTGEPAWVVAYDEDVLAGVSQRWASKPLRLTRPVTSLQRKIWRWR